MASRRYKTPPVRELERLLWVKRGTNQDLNEVQPGVYIGNIQAARNKHLLQCLNITHVLNAAHGTFSYSSSTGEAFYQDVNISYCGVPANDIPSFNISRYFSTAAEFIHTALSQAGGKVLVHCAMGVSRSATLVLAYLMIQQNMSLVQAITAVSEHRNISPNPGFLEQLRELDKQLTRQRAAAAHT
ncbi:dual specificity phosphatase 29-like [Danio aesculapii]|uniref:dual specificity phosphatase 29-like n=1 Tax=Danio aesculapii TaxID=1142201 RepID=UPI0024C0CDB1|nr:dual specificity phosphatase 29-like [Danio aesculapii]